jgi:hypothetical protein
MIESEGARARKNDVELESGAPAYMRDMKPGHYTRRKESAPVRFARLREDGKGTAHARGGAMAPNVWLRLVPPHTAARCKIAALPSA